MTTLVNASYFSCPPSRIFLKVTINAFFSSVCLCILYMELPVLITIRVIPDSDQSPWTGTCHKVVFGTHNIDDGQTIL